MDSITALIQGLQEQLLTLVVPIAVIGLILWGISIALQPIIPEWAQGMRGYFQRLCLTVAVVGGATTIVTGLYGLFGSGG